MANNQAYYDARKILEKIAGDSGYKKNNDYQHRFWAEEILKNAYRADRTFEHKGEHLYPIAALIDVLKDLAKFSRDIPGHDKYLKQVCGFFHDNFNDRASKQSMSDKVSELYKKTQKASNDHRSSVHEFFFENLRIDPSFKEQCRLKHNLEQQGLGILEGFPLEGNREKRDLIDGLIWRNYPDDTLYYSKLRGMNEFLASDKDVATKKAFLEMLPKIKEVLDLRGDACHEEVNEKAKEVLDSLCSPELLASKDAMSSIRQLSSDLEGAKLAYIIRNGMGLSCEDARNFTITLNSPASASVTATPVATATVIQANHARPSAPPAPKRG